MAEALSKPDPHAGEELLERIKREVIGRFGSDVPEGYALAWQGYAAALLELNLIAPETHLQVVNLLPLADNEPIVAIFGGQTAVTRIAAEDRDGTAKRA